jgi:hypothetical protein
MQTERHPWVVCPWHWFGKHGATLAFLALSDNYEEELAMSLTQNYSKQRKSSASSSSWSLTSVAEAHVAEFLIDITGLLDTGDWLMVGSADWRIALRATSSLHGHTTLAHREWMPVHAPVPMSGTTELSLHGCNDHSHLAFVPTFVEKAADVGDFINNAARWARVSYGQIASMVEMLFSGRLDGQQRLPTITAWVQDSTLQGSKVRPENVALCLLKGSRAVCGSNDQHLACHSVLREVNREAALPRLMSLPVEDTNQIWDGYELTSDRQGSGE